MLQKSTNLSESWGVIGQACIRFAAPPLPPTPPSPSVPPPPSPGVPPVAPPASFPVQIVIFEYQDGNGDCWRVTEYVGTGGLVERFQKTPIECY